MLLYLLSIPFGQSFPGLLRQIMLAAVLVGMIWLIFRPRPLPRDVAPFRFLWPMLLFGASAVASIVFSSDPRFSLQASRFLPIALLFFLAIQQIGLSMSAVHRLVMALWCVVVMLSVDGLYQFLTGASLLGGSSLLGGRVSASIPHPNDLALIPIFLPLVLALLTVKMPAAVRWLVWLSVPLAVATLIVSRSRNAWLGLVVCFIVWLAYGQRRKMILATLAAVAVVFLVGYLLDLGGLQSRLASFTHLGEEGRIGIWLVAWEMFKDAPLLGKGAHVFGQFYIEYLARIDLPQGYRPEIAFIPWAHNIYLEFLCERGLLGFVAFAVVVVAMVCRLRSALKQAVPPEARAYFVGLIGSLAVFLVMGLLDLTFLKDWVMLVFWLLAALAARLPDLISAACTSPAEIPSGPPR